MQRIWQSYQSKIDLYLFFGFLSLAIISIAFKPNSLFVLFGLSLLTISPIIVYLFLWLWVKTVVVKRIKKQRRFIRIPNKCLGCDWYYGKMDLKYLSLCKISPYLKEKYLDFQHQNTISSWEGLSNN